MGCGAVPGGRHLLQSQASHQAEARVAPSRTTQVEAAAEAQAQDEIGDWRNAYGSICCSGVRTRGVGGTASTVTAGRSNKSDDSDDDDDNDNDEDMAWHGMPGADLPEAVEAVQRQMQQCRRSGAKARLDQRT